MWKADKPFLSAEFIRRWKARWPNWPPKDGSPPLAIEPWGKQFFVYRKERIERNAPTVEDIRPQWWRDEMNQRHHEGEGVRLCITDFRQRPLTYLTKEEWEAFRAKIPFFLEELRKFEARVPPPDNTEKLQHLEYPQKSPKIGRNPGNRGRSGFQSGRPKPSSRSRRAQLQ